MQRLVVVSGGGTGIGRVVAERFAGAGDTVVIVGRRAERLAEAVSLIAQAAVNAPPVLPLVADLRDVEQVQSVGEQILSRYGRVDVLINAAGGNVEIGASVEALPGLSGVRQRWMNNFELNVLTAVLLTESLKESIARNGRILLFSSIAAFRGSGSGSYAAAKAALHPYAVDLASELGERGITANVIAPGYVEGTEFFRGQMSERRHAQLIGQTCTGRAGTPQDVADAAFWLASPDAGHVSAQIVQVNGGALAGR